MKIFGQVARDLRRLCKKILENFELQLSVLQLLSRVHRSLESTERPYLVWLSYGPLGCLASS